jgi:VanZ family protein
MEKNEQIHTRLTSLNPLISSGITSRLFLFFWIYALFLVVMNLTPGNTQPLEMKKIMFIRSDYFYHAGAYTVLVGLFMMSAFSPRPVFRKYNMAAGITILILLATLPEMLQNYVPQRRFNWYDMLANFTGLALGAAGMLVLIKICRKRK